MLISAYYDTYSLVRLVSQPPAPFPTMPSTRITIALNSKQSQKAPLIIPSSPSFDPNSPSSCQSLVIKNAQSKLRLRKASRVFVSGGRELIEPKDWQDVLENDVLFLVSAGEDFVGLKTDNENTNVTENVYNGIASASNGNASRPITINVLADKAFVDVISVTQLETTARSLPGIIQAVAQPDLHPGTKFPIGAVFVSEEWIHPPLIGGDIGCGMSWYKTKLSRYHVEGDKGRKVAEKLRGLEGVWRMQEDRELWLKETKDDFSAGERWDTALGTIGAGNHFAELQVVEEALSAGSGDNAKRSPFALYEGEVVLLVHSGSRGYGADILRRFTTNGQNSIHQDDPLATQYLEEHDKACGWASRNRDLIALRFLACLEPGNEEWKVGINEKGIRATTEEINTARFNVRGRKVVDIWHNNVEVTPWPPRPPRSSDNGTSSTDTPHKVFIHRKGAAPTYDPVTQQPLSILPLPGSRGTPTLILHPTFTAVNDWGLINANSIAHGAGRLMSRVKAASYISQKYRGKTQDLLRGDLMKTDKKGAKSAIAGSHAGEGVSGGTWVICEDKQLVWEEAPEAYKDVWEVGADLVAKGAAEQWGWCRGRISYKVRNDY